MRHILKRIMQCRVFVLGAGFSRDAGVPLTNDLLPLTMSKFKAECPGLFERVENYVRICFGLGDGKVDYSKLSFCDLCTFLEFVELREYAGGERWSNNGSREKIALKFYLAKTIAEMTPSGDEIPDLYIQFAKQLRNGDVVISFNWDCLLENALEHIQKEYSYVASLEKVGIIKMHGSVHWQASADIEAANSLLAWGELQFNSAMESVPKLYSSKKLMKFENWQGLRPLMDIFPFLVLPGYGKAFDVRSISSLWYKTDFIFGYTHDIYIIGLSLSHDDFFIKSFFINTLPDVADYTSIRGRKIVIINPDPSLKKNYSFLNKTKNVEMLRQHFDISHVKKMINRLERLRRPQMGSKIS